MIKIHLEQMSIGGITTISGVRIGRWSENSWTIGPLNSTDFKGLVEMVKLLSQIKGAL